MSNNEHKRRQAFHKTTPKNLKLLNYKATLYPCNIESLHISIPIDLGLDAISYWLNNKSNLISNRFSQNFLLEALEFILRKNYFKFGEVYYDQREGTAEGTKCAPSFTCLIVVYKEETNFFSD